MSFFGLFRSATSVNLDFQVNDPQYPELKINVTVPYQATQPPFTVAGWNGISDLTPQQKQAAQVYASVYLGLETARKYSRKPVRAWPATKNLIVMPRAGRDFNAYYDRNSLKFFFFQTGTRTIYACESLDIVTHELGHGVLDVLRPDLWNVQSLEIFAFHESFGDIFAIINSLQNEVLKDKLILGDLRQPNFINRIAEEFGQAMYAAGQRGNCTPTALREVFHPFSYINPQNLPNEVKDASFLSKEPHNFSRVFTAAWYEMLVGMYELYKKQMSPIKAIAMATDVSSYLILNGVTFATTVPLFFQSVAQSMTALALGTFGKDVHDVVEAAFESRNIVAKSLPLTGAIENRSLTNFTSIKLAQNKQQIKFKLKDYGFGHSLPDVIKNAHVEIPNENIVIMTKNLYSNHNDSLDHANSALQFLHESNNIHLTDNEPSDKTFRVENGCVVRTRTCCR